MGSLSLNSKQRRTLQAIFTDPPSSSIAWKDVEMLFAALGAEVKEGRGSRVRVFLNDRVAVFHRPHPQKETNKATVRDVRGFLKEAGTEDVGV